MTEIKNILYSINSRLDIAVEKLSEFEDKVIETIWNKTKKERSI